MVNAVSMHPYQVASQEDSDNGLSDPEKRDSNDHRNGAVRFPQQALRLVALFHRAVQKHRTVQKAANEIHISSARSRYADQLTSPILNVSSNSCYVLHPR